METDLRAIVDELVTRHQCHTVILYGSRVDGTGSATSDYDVLGIRDGGELLRDCREWGESYLDAWIYPEKHFQSMDESLIHLRGGRILIQKDQLGERILQELDRIYERGPKPMAPDEIQMRRVWVKKMLKRIKEPYSDDIESQYRRIWLLFDLPQLYFQLRRQWNHGSKKAFEWLRQNDPQTFALFEKALKREASWQDIENITRRVFSVVDQK